MRLNLKNKIPFLFLLIGLIACKTEQVPEEKQPVIHHEVQSGRTGIVIPEIPAELSFCGEKIDLNDFDIRERLDKELIVNTYYHSSTVQILKKANRYFPAIEAILKKEGVPDDLKYICVIESALKSSDKPIGCQRLLAIHETDSKRIQLNSYQGGG